MADKKWDKLHFMLNTPHCRRSLQIHAHFKKIGNGWFDTGRYRIKEGTLNLGYLEIDLYTNNGASWHGSTYAFTEERAKIYY